LNWEREGEKILRHHLPGAEVQMETASDPEIEITHHRQGPGGVFGRTAKTPVGQELLALPACDSNSSSRASTAIAHQALLEADAELFNRLYNSEGDAPLVLRDLRTRADSSQCRRVPVLLHPDHELDAGTSS
jgi:hypothetical protein